jgi:uncharacterized membrane protein
MEILIKTGRSFYAIAIAGIGFQHFYYASFHPVILPGWPAIAAVRFWAYVAGTVLMVAGIAILFEKKVVIVSLLLGAVLLLLVCFSQVPYEIIIDPNKKYHLGLWTSALKELALSGGAFVIAGSFLETKSNDQKKSALIKLLGKFIPAGPVFFSITMISFGIDHFLYTQNISTLVPGWIPYPIFWTYFAAVALIGSGVAIIFKIKIKLIARLLGAMILLWFVLLHIPRAIADPFANTGNEVTSAFTALAFSGIAFVIGSGYQGKKDRLEQAENIF